MKQQWIKVAWAGIAVLLYSALPVAAQTPGGYYGGRFSAYPPSQQSYGQGYANYGPSSYGQGQGYGNPGLYGAPYSGQGQGYYNQPGQPIYYGQGSYNQGGSGWNQPSTWGGNQGGQYPPVYHYNRGYQDGYNHGYQTSRTQPGAFAGPGGAQGHPGAFHYTRIRGDLQHVKQVQIPGLEEPMMVGIVTSDQRGPVVVAFGPAKELKNANLQTGQPITVSGEMCWTCNRPMMLAEQVRCARQVDRNPGLPGH